MHRNRQRRIWIVVGALLAAVGAAGSMFAAQTVARNDAQRSHQALVSSSLAIASTLKLAIQQEDSLVISADAFTVANPNASNAEFLSWVGTMEVAKRFPEVSGLGYIAVVRPGQLPQFVARLLADPPQPLAAGQSLNVTPAGNRPFYCLDDFGYLNGGPTVPLGYDVCAGTNSALIAKAFAENTYLPYKLGGKDYLTIEAPIYSGGVIPATAQARTASVLGLVGLTTLPSFVLEQSLEGHPRTAVAFHYGSGASKVTFKAGAAPAGSKSNSVNLHNGWHVETFGTVDGSGVFGNAGALALLLAGFVLSLLLGALIYVLGTSRSRALIRSYPP